MKSRVFLLAALALLLPAATARAQSTAFTVSPKGSDTTGTGTGARPFASLARALAAARAKGTRSEKHPALIFLRGGEYSLKETISLTEADSHLRIEAWPRERVTLSGGVRLKLAQVAPGRWEGPAPFAFEQLYVGAERRYRPRLPRKTYWRIARDLPLLEGRTYERLGFEAGQIKADWANRSDIEVLAFQNWTMARLKLKRVFEDARIAEFTGGTIGSQSFMALSAGKRFIVENVKEALSEPGEWYYDRSTGRVSYLPLFDEKLASTAVVAPRLSELLRIEGAKNITVKGVGFAHAAWSCPPQGHSFWQAEVNLPAAVTVRDSNEIAFEGCAIKNVGAWAISFEAGTKNSKLLGCELTDLGAGGVKIGEMSLPGEPGQRTDSITVQDCLIAHGGRVHPAGVGVWIGHSARNQILHNEITDFYYTGISPGWSWGYGESGAHHNEIGYNRISHIGQGVLSDMGGIYTLGVSPGTTLHHNVISDVESDEYGGWGIYFDEGTTGAIAENNLVYRTKSAPFHQHYGRDNLVRNNIFAFGREAQLMRTRAEEHLSFTLERNLIYWREGPLLGLNWTGEPGKSFTLSGNLYFKVGGGAAVPAGDTRGKVADPKFFDPEKGDFRLKPGSPALAMGFEPWDFSKAGRTGRKPYTGSVARAYPPLPPPEPPRPIAEDFEDQVPGASYAGFGAVSATDLDVKDARIAVSREQAASGSLSLRFTDAPGQAARYNPHLYFRPKLVGRELIGSFALHPGAGTVFYHEWRDASSPYHIGPSLRIEGGQLLIAGKPLMSIPTDAWTRFEVRCAPGSGVWELIVRPSGRTAPARFAGLPCGSGKAFQTLAWWGFVSDADAATTFYLDDLSLKAEK